MWSSLKSCLALEVCWKCGASKESANPEMCYVNLSRDAPWRHVSVAMWSTQPSFAKIAPCLHERGEATLYTNLYRLKILQLILFDRLARLVLETCCTSTQTGRLLGSHGVTGYVTLLASWCMPGPDWIGGTCTCNGTLLARAQH